jgi:MoaA/NifB/PqqE/SkfB family radical SAM enzyme
VEFENSEPNDQLMKVHYFINCLKSLHHNLYQVTLTGGEPLLFKNDVLLIAEEAYKFKVPMVTISNGRFLNEYFLNKYKYFGHTLVISVDSIEKQKWNEFRGRNNFAIVMPKIMLSKQILGDNLRIQSVLSKESADEIPKVIDFCKKHNIHHNIQLNQDFGGKWTNLKRLTSIITTLLLVLHEKIICIYPNVTC